VKEYSCKRQGKKMAEQLTKNYLKGNKMKKIFYFLMIVVLIGVAGCSSKPGAYDSLAQCLTEKGATMYGTEWCPHCQNQKKMFGKSFQYIVFVDCDLNSDECLKNGVSGYPTWKIGDENYPGEQSLERLAFLADCEV
jgi:glutaredoxin